MSGGESLGTLILSVDLEPDAESQIGHRERQFDEVRSQLLGLTKANGIPATWAVADPMLSAAREAVMSAHCGHEMAVVGDRAWLGPGCGRARLSRELTRRFSVPRKAGIPVSTLALRNVDHLDELELLRQHGVSAVCGMPVDRPLMTASSAQPPIRFGVWQPPSAWRLPLARNWWSPTAWHIRREIKRTIRWRTLLHLRLDVTRLTSPSQPMIDCLSSLLHFVATKRDSGQLAIKTIGQLAMEALRSRAAQPSRSILRPAA